MGVSLHEHTILALPAFVATTAVHRAPKHPQKKRHDDIITDAEPFTRQLQFSLLWKTQLACFGLHMLESKVAQLLHQQVLRPRRAHERVAHAHEVKTEKSLNIIAGAVYSVQVLDTRFFTTANVTNKNAPLFHYVRRYDPCPL